jgi:hypothetical protein
MKATFSTIDGNQKTRRVDYLRFDKVHIKREESDEMVGVDIDFGDDVVDWDKAGRDCLRYCYSDHFRLRKHRYLD